MEKSAPTTADQVGAGVGATGVAIDATHVYWTNRGTNGLLDGTVARALKNGTGAEVLASSLDSPFIITLDATHAYWTSRATGSVSRVPKTGGSPQLLATGKGDESINGWGIVVTAGTVFWRDGELFRRVPAAGGAASDVATDQPIARFLTLFGSNLYWGSGPQQAAQLWTLDASAPAGTLPTPITGDSLPGHHGVAADDDYVYFTNWGSDSSPTGAVFKVAHP
jgi:hypothetical protein